MSNQQIQLRDNCPHCGLTLTSDLGARREFGVNIPGVYDGVLFWECPACGGTWHRFDMTSPLHHRAEKFMKTGDGHA